MKLRTILLLSTVFMSQAFADPHPGDEGARNKDGSVVTGILTAQFDPSNLILPFPSNLLFVAPTPTADLTLSAPEQLSRVDGFSTTERWVTTFTDRNGEPGSIDPLSVEAGKSVRVFEVESVPPWVAVVEIRRELTPGLEYVAAASGNVVAIVPTVPLKEYTTYLAVLTNDIRDSAGNNATPDLTYHLTKRRTPWVDGDGKSTYPLLDDETANRLEPLRLMTLSMEFAAGTEGVNMDDIILSWMVHTQSISTPTRLLYDITEPAEVLALPTPFDTSILGPGVPGLADIVVGIITLPYYLEAPSAANPTAPLTEAWKAAPGAYVPPFNQFGLDPTSTAVTQANPFPVPTGMQTVPFIMTVPNAKSGQPKPPEGWPVVIYNHGLTRNRTDALALADAMALAGMVVISMDQPLHGVVPAVEPWLEPFYIKNHPVFGALANERTFDLDFFDNETGAPGGDGLTDPSGTIPQATLLLNPVMARDGMRQATADLFVLARSLQNISVDGDDTPDLNPFNVGALTHSLGTTTGIPFMAIEDGVSRGYINAATGALLRTGLGGGFGDDIKAALASVGIIEGTPQFELTITVIQTAIDPADGVNYAAEAAQKKPILHNVVFGDRTVSNGVPGQPLAGSFAINRLMGLQPYGDTTSDQNGLRGVATFLPPAFHESLFRPVSDDPPFEVAPEVTKEMQGQAASFLSTGGTFVLVGDPNLLVQQVAREVLAPELPGTGAPGKKKKKRSMPVDEVRVDRLKKPTSDVTGRQ